MAEFFEFQDVEERVILVGVQTYQSDDTLESLDELEELAATAGAGNGGESGAEQGGGSSRNLYWKRKNRGDQRASHSIGCERGNL